MTSLSKYYLTVSRVDGSLYVSDYQQRRVIRLTTDDVRSRHEAASDVEVVAGNGQICVRGGQSQCGDGQLAIHAALSHPKGANHHYRHHHYTSSSSSSSGWQVAPVGCSRMCNV